MRAFLKYINKSKYSFLFFSFLVFVAYIAETFFGMTGQTKVPLLVRFVVDSKIEPEGFFLEIFLCFFVFFLLIFINKSYDIPRHEKNLISRMIRFFGWTFSKSVMLVAGAAFAFFIGNYFLSSMAVNSEDFFIDQVAWLQASGTLVYGSFFINCRLREISHWSVR